MTAAEVAVILGIFLTSLHICEKLLTLEKMLIERKSPKKKVLGKQAATVSVSLDRGRGFRLSPPIWVVKMI